jgi:hypothetical protein
MSLNLVNIVPTPSLGFFVFKAQVYFGLGGEFEIKIDTKKYMSI